MKHRILSLLTMMLFIVGGTWAQSNATAVDLGLSVKWADMNVGAINATDYGNYYAWGETTTKATYTWDNYAYGGNNGQSLTKYNINDQYGLVDNKTTLDSSDDAATANMGSGWRTPTSAEMKELLATKDNANYTWVWQNNFNGSGVKGYLVTYTVNGNSIFLPAAGEKVYSDPDNTSACYYMTADLCEVNSSLCQRTFLSDYYFFIDYNNRNKGIPVRAVEVPSEGEPIEAELVDGLWQFEMPQENPVELTIQYQQLPTVTVAEMTNGTVVSDKAYADEGETVVLTVTPAEGYVLKEGSLKATFTPDDGAAQEVTLTQDASDATKYSFAMPAGGFGDVAIAAAFELVPYAVFSVSEKADTPDDAKGGAISVKAGETEIVTGETMRADVEGQTVKVTVTPKPGYRVKSVKVVKKKDAAAAPAAYKTLTLAANGTLVPEITLNYTDGMTWSEVVAANPDKIETKDNYIYPKGKTYKLGDYTTMSLVRPDDVIEPTHYFIWD